MFTKIPYISFKQGVFACTAFAASILLIPSLLSVYTQTQPWSLPAENIPQNPRLQPSVVTSSGKRHLLDAFGVSDIVRVRYDEQTNSITSSPKGWYIINYPLERILGMDGFTNNQRSQILFGHFVRDDINWNIFTPGNDDSEIAVKPGTKQISLNPTYIVDNTSITAKDTNPGTPEKPFVTIQKAYENAQPGDIIQVRAGTYDSDFVFDKNGTKENPIIIEGVSNSSGQQPILIDSDGIKITGGFTTLRNFELRDRHTQPQQATLEVIADPLGGQVIEYNYFNTPGMRGLTFTLRQGALGNPAIARGNHIINAGHMAIGTNGDPTNWTEENQNGNTPGTGPFILEYNYIAGGNTKGFDQFWEGGGHKSVYATQSIIRYNEMYDVDGNGWWLDFENFNNRIEGNLVVRARGGGIALGEASPGPNLAINNIVAGTRDAGDWFKTHIMSWDSTRGYAYYNTTDSIDNPDINGYNLVSNDANRGTKWEPYINGFETKHVNNVSFGASRAFLYGFNDPDYGNYTNIGNSVTYEEIKRDGLFDGTPRLLDRTTQPASQYVSNPSELDYRVTENSKLSKNLARYDFQYSGLDFYGLPRGLQGHTPTVGATRSFIPTNESQCEEQASIEIYSLLGIGGRRCGTNLFELQNQNPVENPTIKTGTTRVLFSRTQLNTYSE